MRSTRMMAVMMAALLLAASAGPAWAVDAPKWVAAVYMAAQNAVGLRWNGVPGATGYKVLRSMAKGKDYVEIYSGAQPQFFDKTVEPADTYFYVLQAIDAGGPSANSEEKSVLIPGQKVQKVEPPQWDRVTSTETTEFGKTSFKVGLFWKKNPNPNIVAYNVYRSEAKGKDYQLLGSVSETQYVDVAVQQDKTYYYVLTALDNAFEETKHSEEKDIALKVTVQAAKPKKEEVPNPKLAVRKTKLLKKVESGENYTFRAPGDTGVDADGNIYIMDAGLNNVKVFDQYGEYIQTIGESGIEEGKILFAMGMGVTPEGDVYVGDRTTPGRIVVYDSKGKWLRNIIAPPVTEERKKKFNIEMNPVFADVAVDPKSGQIYGIDNNAARVCVFDSRGKFLFEFGDPGSDNGQFVSPGWCAINAKGELHICNGLNRRVEVFDLEGKFLRKYGISKSFIGSFIGPTGITFDDAGRPIVMDTAMGTIQAFDAEKGDYLYSFGDETGAIDQESKQRPILPIRSPVGVTFNPKTKALVFSLAMDKAFMIREILPE